MKIKTVSEWEVKVNGCLSGATRETCLLWMVTVTYGSTDVVGKAFSMKDH